MSVYTEVKNEILSLPEGSLVSSKDLDVPSEQRALMQKTLSDLFKQGVLQRLTQSLYYKPKETQLGEIPPSSSAIVEKLLQIYRKNISYITGASVYTRLGLTTQWTPEVIVATDKPRKYPVKIGPLKVQFVPSRVTTETQNTYLLQLLDALKDIKAISGTTPTEVALRLQSLIGVLPYKEKKLLAQYALSYPASTRALLGLLFERLGKKSLAKVLKETLAPTSKYAIPLSTDAFPSSVNWQII